MLRYINKIWEIKLMMKTTNSNLTEHLWKEYNNNTYNTVIDKKELGKSVDGYIKARNLNGAFSTFYTHKKENHQNLSSYWLIKIFNALHLKYNRDNKKFKFNAFHKLEEELQGLIIENRV